MEIVRDYLKRHENEIIDMIMSVLSQDEAIKMYGKECERRGIIRAAVRIFTILNVDYDKANKILAEEFNISAKECLEYINKLWQNFNPVTERSDESYTTQ